MESERQANLIEDATKMRSQLEKQGARMKAELLKISEAQDAREEEHKSQIESLM